MPDPATESVARSDPGNRLEQAARSSGRKRDDARFVFSLMDWTNHTHSMGEFLKKIQSSWDIMPLAGQITVPFLSLQSEGEGENASRAAQAFFEALTCEKKHIVLKAENGADQHCAMNNIEFASDLVYPWFQKVLAERTQPLAVNEKGGFIVSFFIHACGITRRNSAPGSRVFDTIYTKVSISDRFSASSYIGPPVRKSTA